MLFLFIIYTIPFYSFLHYIETARNQTFPVLSYSLPYNVNTLFVTDIYRVSNTEKRERVLIAKGKEKKTRDLQYGRCKTTV